MRNDTSKIPAYFWVLATFFLLWNIMGVASFLMHTFISDESLALLPVAEQELYNSYPMWTIVAFGIAVLGGFLGSIGLLRKRKWSKLLFIISLFGIVPQMIHNVFFTKTLEVYGPEAALMPMMVVVFGAFLVWFADLGIKKSWLR